MSSPGDSIFSHVRTKLRQSRSSVMLTSSTHSQLEYSNWDNVPAAFRPVERAEVRVVNGYYLSRPLPGPPPHPRTASSSPVLEARANLGIGNPRNPTPRTHRSRSADIAQRRWSGPDEREVDIQNKRASVNIAIALPPDHLDPPPPYSRYPDPPSTDPEPRPRSQPPLAHAVPIVKLYGPNDYVSHRSQNTRREVDGIPIITAPEPPTPVSPLNNLDFQYLAMRHPPPSESNVTIESLLTHPLLR